MVRHRDSSGVSVRPSGRLPGQPPGDLIVEGRGQDVGRDHEQEIHEHEGDQIEQKGDAMDVEPDQNRHDGPGDLGRLRRAQHGQQLVAVAGEAGKKPRI